MIFTVIRYVGKKGDWFLLGNLTDKIDDFVFKEGGQWFLEPSHPRLIVVQARVAVPAANIAGWLSDIKNGELDVSRIKIQQVPCDGLDVEIPSQILEWVKNRLG